MWLKTIYFISESLSILDSTLDVGSNNIKIDSSGLSSHLKLRISGLEY